MPLCGMCHTLVEEAGEIVPYTAFAIRKFCLGKYEELTEVMGAGPRDTCPDWAWAKWVYGGAANPWKSLDALKHREKCQYCYWAGRGVDPREAISLDLPFHNTNISQLHASPSTTTTRGSKAPITAARTGNSPYRPSNKLPLGVDLPDGVRLSQVRTKLNTGGMERFLRRVGITSAEYGRWVGQQALSAYVAANRHQTMRQWEIMVLENLAFVKAKEAN